MCGQCIFLKCLRGLANVVYIYSCLQVAVFEAYNKLPIYRLLLKPLIVINIQCVYINKSAKPAGKSFKRVLNILVEMDCVPAWLRLCFI